VKPDPVGCDPLSSARDVENQAVRYIDDNIKKICNDSDFLKLMASIHPPVMYLGSDDFGKFMKQATAGYAKLIKDLNITID